jgi:hypothetical protein
MYKSVSLVISAMCGNSFNSHGMSAVIFALPAGRAISSFDFCCGWKELQLEMPFY